MLTSKELQILELFRINLFASFTIMEVMKKIKTKSYNWTHNAIKKLQKGNILAIKRIGQNQLCSINLNEHKTIAYLSLAEELNISKQNVPNLKRIQALMPGDFHIFIVTGSYAGNTFTRKSDLDIVVIIERKENKKFLLNNLSSEGELMIPPLHPYVFTREEFFEMLTNKEENYGKEITRKKIIIEGAELYYNILNEAIEHGFKG
ncbi:nucleotidyltransferase domain-containing protein [Candidatus Woesearchaeota archaeon]|nr:nucleotidyltransferase domain-containing protein [Candidatus Woesearchaeota archaeon]